METDVCGCEDCYGGSEDDEEDAATTEEGSYGRAGGQLPEIVVRISKIKALHRNQRLI